MRKEDIKVLSKRKKLKKTHYYIFFFQAEDGIRDGHVTGVQTCALPICFRARGRRHRGPRAHLRTGPAPRRGARAGRQGEIGRASCRERGYIWGGGAP